VPKIKYKELANALRQDLGQDAANIDDVSLVQAWVADNPQYKNDVIFDDQVVGPAKRTGNLLEDLKTAEPLPRTKAAFQRERGGLEVPFVTQQFGFQGGEMVQPARPEIDESSLETPFVQVDNEPVISRGVELLPTVFSNTLEGQKILDFTKGKKDVKSILDYYTSVAQEGALGSESDFAKASLLKNSLDANLKFAEEQYNDLYPDAPISWEDFLAKSSDSQFQQDREILGQELTSLFGKMKYYEAMGDEQSYSQTRQSAEQIKNQYESLFGDFEQVLQVASPFLEQFDQYGQELNQLNEKVNKEAKEIEETSFFGKTALAASRFVAGGGYLLADLAGAVGATDIADKMKSGLMDSQLSTKDPRMALFKAPYDSKQGGFVNGGLFSTNTLGFVFEQGLNMIPSIAAAMTPYGRLGQLAIGAIGTSAMVYDEYAADIDQAALQAGAKVDPQTRAILSAVGAAKTGLIENAIPINKFFKTGMSKAFSEAAVRSLASGKSLDFAIKAGIQGLKAFSLTSGVEVAEEILDQGVQDVINQSIVNQFPDLAGQPQFEPQTLQSYGDIAVNTLIAVAPLGGTSFAYSGSRLKEDLFHNVARSGKVDVTLDLFEENKDKFKDSQYKKNVDRLSLIGDIYGQIPENIDDVSARKIADKMLEIESINSNMSKNTPQAIRERNTAKIDKINQEISSIFSEAEMSRPAVTEAPEEAFPTIELQIPESDQNVLNAVSERIEPIIAPLVQRMTNAEEIDMAEIEAVAEQMIDEQSRILESESLSETERQNLSDLIESQIDNLLNYEFATTTITEQAGQGIEVKGVVRAAKPGLPQKISAERFHGATITDPKTGEKRIVVLRRVPITQSRSGLVYQLAPKSFSGKLLSSPENRQVVSEEESKSTPFSNMEYVSSVFDDAGRFMGVILRDANTGEEIQLDNAFAPGAKSTQGETMGWNDLALDIAIAESQRQIGTVPEGAFIRTIQRVVPVEQVRKIFPNLRETGTAPEAAGVQPQTEQDVRQETNVTQERGDEGEASSRLPQEEGRQEGQVTPAVEGEAQASPTAKKKKTAQEKADEEKAEREKLAKILEKLKDALKSSKAKSGGGANIDLTFGVVPITKAVWNTAIDTAILAIDAGQTIAQAVKAASDYISSQIQGDWGKGKFESYMNDQFSPTTQPDVLKDVESTAKALEEKYSAQPIKRNDIINNNPQEIYALSIGINPSNLSYLGKGDFGKAYSTDIGTVIKITSSANEAEIALSLIGKKGNHAEIYDVKKVENEFIIHQEELDTDSEIEDNLQTIENILNEQELAIQYLNYLDYDELSQESKDEYDSLSNFISDLEDINRLYRNLGIEASDLQSGNLGYDKNGKLKAFDLQDKSSKIKSKDVNADALKDKNQVISEAYHKAKKDGSNPELVKAVEDLLGGEQQQEKAEKPIAESFANDLDAEYSKMKDSFFGGMEPNKNRLFFTDATNDFQYRGDSRADIVLMLDGANFWLTEGPDGYVTIEDFQVSEDKLGTGKGKFALSKLIEYADRNGITLIGEPLAQAERGRTQKGLSQKQLIEFYKKNGFEKISKDSLSKNRTAEANYLERKPKDSVEKTETEKPIAESRREFREKARKYFDGLKKLGFAYDPERNAKEDIAFLKALKDYIKLEIDNGMVTFKGFIEKTANLIEGFNEKDIASAAKKMWAEEIVKAYPKIYSKLQKAKKDLLDKEIQEARVTLQNSLKELLSDKKIFRKISSLTTERKLDKLSSDILVGMREEIEALGGLKKLSDEDLLFYNEMATQAYKEGQVIQGELINALKAKKEADKKNAKSAITNQDERSVVELKDANEAREFLSKNKGNNSNQVNINNGEIIVDSVEEFDILSSMFDEQTTFGGTTTAPNPNSVKRGKGSYYRTTVGGGLIYLLDKLKGKTPSQETINFFNDLIGQVKSGTFRKKRLNAELNNNRTSNISFLFKNRFAYTRRMLSTPRINGEKLVINDQNGSEIKNLSINHVLFFYQLMKDPHFLEGVKKKDGKIARKIGLEEQSMRDIIDFVNLEENSDLRELMSNDQVLIKRAAQNAAHVMEASNISSEMLNPRPLNLSAYENDQFIGEILNKIYNNSVPTEIEYFPSSVESDTNDQTPDVDALLGEDLGGKTVSAMSRFMIEREVGGTVKVKSYDAQLGEYFESMSNTAAKLPILKRFQAIFNKENTDLISSYYGKNTTSELKENIARYIVGRPQDAWLSKTISEGVLGKWLSLGLGIQMFLNLATALSQLSSSPGPILAYGVGNYLNGLSMLISGEADFKDSLLSLSSGKLFRERLGSRIDAAAIVKSIPSDERGYAAYFNEFNKKLISFGSAASSYFDAASILLSLPIYAREYSNARRTMTDQEAKDYAEEKIMDLAELFLQTRNEEMISSAESRYRTTLYSFATIVPQLHRQAIMAAKRIQRKEGDVKQNLNVLAWSAIGSSVAFRLLRPYFESIFEGDDEDEELKNLRSDKRTKRVALDLAVDATKSFGLYGAVSSAILKTGYQLVEAEEDASKVRMALDITPEIIESIPSVSIKLRNINDAIKSYYDDENLKGTTQGIQALTGLPIEKARMFAVQMSDGFLSDQFSMAEKVARISGFISENKAKEKLFQKAMSTDPLLREKLSPSEIQRFTTKQKNEYKSATSIIARQYSEATTESEREAAISRLISLQSGATKYDNAEELVNQIQDDFDKKVYENMLPKEFLEIKKMPSTKKVNFVANEFNATKNEQEAIDYLETLSAYGVISDNEKSEIVEILLKSNKAK
jgi:GNAT superfamily N-acetyltransferase